MKMFKIMLILLVVAVSFIGCSTTIVEPKEDEIIDCAWLTLNDTRAWGVNMTETPSGVKVYRVRKILLNKTQFTITTTNIAHEDEIVEYTATDILNYEEADEDEF